MCGKLKPGNTVISIVAPDYVKDYLDMIVGEGEYKTRSQAAGMLLKELVDERQSDPLTYFKKKNENQPKSDINSKDNPIKDRPPLDEETFTKLPKTFQYFSMMLEKANEK